MAFIWKIRKFELGEDHKWKADKNIVEKEENDRSVAEDSININRTNRRLHHVCYFFIITKEV